MLSNFTRVICLTLALAAGLFAQPAPSTNFTNFYALSVSDPQADALVAYLGQFGVPAPVRADNVYAVPNQASYHYESLTFALPDGSVQVTSLSLAVAAPNMVLNELASKGLIKLASPLPPFAAVAGVNVPIPDVPPTPVLPPSAASPLGAQINPPLNSIGSRFFIVPSDQSAGGTIYTAPDGKKYQKHLQVTPFGNSAWWERVA